MIFTSIISQKIRLSKKCFLQAFIFKKKELLLKIQNGPHLSFYLTIRHDLQYFTLYHICLEKKNAFHLRLYIYENMLVLWSIGSCPLKKKKSAISFLMSLHTPQYPTQDKAWATHLQQARGDTAIRGQKINTRTQLVGWVN